MLIPDDDGPRDRRRSTRRPTARARARRGRARARAGRAAARRRRRRAPRRSTTPELLVNDLEAAALSLRPRIAEALAALDGGRGGARAGDRLGADGGRAVRATSSPPTRPRRRCRPATRTRSSPRRSDSDNPAGASSRARSGTARPAGRDRRRRRGRASSPSSQLGPDIDLEQLLEDLSSRLGDLDLRARRRCSRSSRRAPSSASSFPGETVVILGGAVAGQGETSIVITIAIVWFCAWAGDTDELLHRPAARARVHPRHGAEGADHPGALRAGRDVLPAPRRQDDPDRALHRPGARAGAVHRRQLGDGATARSSPTACSAPASGRRRSRCSATCVAESLDKATRDRRDRGIFVFGARGRDDRGRGGRLGSCACRENRRAPARADGAARCCGRWSRGAGRPEARFLWNRVTPGGLGLEFTSADGGRSRWRCSCSIGYALIVSDDPGPTPGDTAAFDVVDATAARTG